MKQIKYRTDILMNDPAWVQSERDRGREKHHRLNYGNKYHQSTESKRETMKRYYDKYPEKKISRRAIGNIYPFIKGNELHHWSYNKEHYNSFIELSVKDHNTAHRFIIYDQERMMYRKLSGELLDTKESHEEYIMKMIKEAVN